MITLRTLFLLIWLWAIFGTRLWGEKLPHRPVENATLEAEMIVEGRLNSDKNAVRVEKVHLGNVKPGETISITWSDILPMNAYPSCRLAESNSKGGVSVAGNLVVLFLVHEEGRYAMSPFSLGSGVKWLVNDAVYGYMPYWVDSYYLVPETEMKTLDALRAAITVGLEKRHSFEVALADPDKPTRAQRLGAFLEPNQPIYYYFKAMRKIAALGHEGALILQREAVRPEQKTYQQSLLIAIGDSKDSNAIPFLVERVKQSRPMLQDAAVPFDRSKATEHQRDAMSKWQAAIYAMAEIGDPIGLPELREAAVWSAIHRNKEMLEHGVYGMAKAPTAENLPYFRSILTALPRETDGFGRWGTYAVILALNKHQFLDTAPLLISLLDHPADYNVQVVRHGLKELSGKDLGAAPAPWLKWYEDQKGQGQ